VDRITRFPGDCHEDAFRPAKSKPSKRSAEDKSSEIVHYSPQGLPLPIQPDDVIASSTQVGQSPRSGK
jgi:hypothetical protein